MTLDPAIEHLLRTEAPQVLGALVRRFSRFDAAEDAVQEAMLAASAQWPLSGVPSEPRSWLIRVAYRRMVDLLRSEQVWHRRQVEYETSVAPGASSSVDDSLAVLVMCCHPALSPQSQVALTLRAVGGLTTAEIAHAYGTSEATMATRISRAKASLREAGARFSLPTDSERAARMRSVMHVLYLVFNEGYTATAGDSLSRVDLALEAIRLTRMLLAALPSDPEVAGLLALMLLTQSRQAARTGGSDELVLLEEQDRSLWDASLIAEGVSLIDAAWARRAVGPYQLQAAIASVHASSPSAASTDWAQIAGLYLWLERLAPSGPVLLSRVVAVSKAYGAVRGLALLGEVEPLLDSLVAQRRHAVRAHLLEEVGRPAEARAEYLQAAELTANLTERRYLVARAKSLDP